MFFTLKPKKMQSQISELLEATSTVRDFLVASKSVTQKKQFCHSMPSMLIEDLACQLDSIFSKEFLNALFALRNQIRQLATRSAGSATTQIVTLPDMLIASILAYISVDSEPNQATQDDNLNICSKVYLDSESHFVQLAILLPLRLESLSNFIGSTKNDRGYQVDSAAISILYCVRCLNVTEKDKTLEAAQSRQSMDNVVKFLSRLEIDQVLPIVCSHILCLYMITLQKMSFVLLGQPPTSSCGRCCSSYFQIHVF
ncbi:expressed protein [Phakopsora pachyrhizi]|uniref:Expressed protein n=1 Tax=Phakopsora pachyrhizi TaxID=170000 RepID=A0AAV0BIV3_PHAPC|nr:expressed protein [Phakopsora pachyrhizi]